MPLIETKGAASAQGFGLTLSSGAVTYIEDVFSTYLYDGTAAAFSINNSIDLAGKGGLVWLKRRNAANSHWLYYQATKYASSNNDGAGGTSDPGYGITSYNSNGFSLGLNWLGENGSGGTYVSWTFRKQPKFFDIVTYTGNGANRTIAHNLGSVPGCIMVKCLSTGATSWAVYHRSLANTEYLVLNNTAAAAAGTTYWNSTTPTSAVFSLGTNATVNSNGATYVAYLFAHDAGGFGLTGTENVISCGTFTGNTTVNLGWEPQWIILKPTLTTGDWDIHDNMRGWPVSGDARRLKANLSNAEDGTAQIFPNATGFSTLIGPATYIYIAIRRGPMKVPTSGTSVYGGIQYTGTGSQQNLTGISFPPDYVHTKSQTGYGASYLADRLRGPGFRLQTENTSAEADRSSGGILSFNNDGFTVGTFSDVNPNGNGQIAWCFRRSPGFFDVVCYTGTGVARTVNHNLATVPEMMIVKDRAGAGAGNDWAVYVSSVGPTGYLTLNANLEARTVAGGYTKNPWNSTTPTSTVFSVKTDSSVNFNGFTYVAYLFATCPGVSKVGSYTGTGTTQQINCGFTGGARFVLIKRTDSTGDWYVWDTARGIVAGNDPHLSLNSTAAEVTTNDSIDTDSTGFIVNQLAATNINVSSATYIFLAIA